MLTRDQKTRLAKILGLLGSAHDGEVLAAVRKANGLLTENRMTWQEVLEGEGGTNREQWERIYNAGYEAGRRDAPAAAGNGHAGAAEWKPTDPDDLWGGHDPYAVAPHLTEYVDRIDRIWREGRVRLNGWEAGFVTSVAGQVCDWGRLSDKQRAIVDRVFRQRILAVEEAAEWES